MKMTVNKMKCISLSRTAIIMAQFENLGELVKNTIFVA